MRTCLFDKKYYKTNKRWLLLIARTYQFTHGWCKTKKTKEPSESEHILAKQRKNTAGSYTQMLGSCSSDQVILAQNEVFLIKLWSMMINHFSQAFCPLWRSWYWWTLSRTCGACLRRKWVKFHWTDITKLVIVLQLSKLSTVWELCVAGPFHNRFYCITIFCRWFNKSGI